MAELSNHNITVGDIEVDITTRGPEDEAEAAHLHTHDQAVRALQAIKNQKPPEECNGIGVTVNWEKKIEMLGADDVE